MSPAKSAERAVGRPPREPPAADRPPQARRERVLGGKDQAFGDWGPSIWCGLRTVADRVEPDRVITVNSQLLRYDEGCLDHRGVGP